MNRNPLLRHRRTPVLRLLCSLFVLLFAASGFGAAMPVRRIAPGDVPGEYLVGLKDVPREKVDAVAAEIAARTGGQLVAVWKDAVRGFWIRIPDAEAKRLLIDRRVSSVEQNARMHTSSIQETFNTTCTDPERCDRWGQSDLWNTDGKGHPLWHLSRISHRTRVGHEPMRTDDNATRNTTYMWSNDGTGVIAYVVDGGVLRFHREFAASDNLTDAQKKDPNTYNNKIDEVPGSNRIAARGGEDRFPSSAPYAKCLSQSNLTTGELGGLPYRADWPWYDLLNDGNDADTGGYTDHGLGVASILGGRTVGVAKGVKIVPVKANGCGGIQTTADATSALDWIYEQESNPQLAERRLALVNMSIYRDYDIRWPATSPLLPAYGALSLMEEAVETLTDYGIPVITSANNNADTACLPSPARMSRRGGRGMVITVGALAKELDPTKAEMNLNDSNRGPCVDLLAPGGHMPVAYSNGWDRYRHDHDGDNNPANNDGIVRYSGTSYSAPMVAGIAARLMAEDVKLKDLLKKDPNIATNAKFTETIYDRVIAAATILPTHPAEDFDPSRTIGVHTPNRLAYIGSVGITSQPQSRDLASIQAYPLTVAVPQAAPVCRIRWFESDEASYSKVPIAETPGTFTTNTTEKQKISTFNGTPTANRRYFWARVSTKCAAIADNDSEYTDSAIAALTVGCAVIQQQPQGVWVDYNDASRLPLKMVVQTKATGISVQWYRGARGDLTRSIPVNEGTGETVADDLRTYTLMPPIDRSNLQTFTTYWARITTPSCQIDSDVAQVVTCTTPSMTGISVDPPDAEGFVTVRGTGAGGASYCLMMLKDGAWKVYRCLREPEFTDVPGGVQTTFKIRAQNSCSFADSPIHVYTPPANCSYTPSPATAPFPSSRHVDIVQQFWLTQPYTQTSPLIWRSRFFGEPGPGTAIENPQRPIPETIAVAQQTSMVYWTDLQICGQTRPSGKVAVLARPRFTVLPSREVIIAPGGTARLPASAHPLPATPNALVYEWFRGTPADPTLVTTDATLFTSVPGTYFVRVTATYPENFDSEFPAELTAVAESYVVNVVCGAPPVPVFKKRRSSGARPGEVALLSSGKPVAINSQILDVIAPGQTVTVEIDPPQTGVTYAWYEGDDYNDRSNKVGVGTAVVLAPARTTTYWIRATATCQGQQTHTNSDFFIIQVGCDTTITQQPTPDTQVVTARPATVTVGTSVQALTATDIPLVYQWYDDATGAAIANATQPTFTTTLSLGATDGYKSIDVYVIVRRADLSCPVRSATVRLAAIPAEPQRIAAYDSGATVYSYSLPEKLRVLMEPLAHNPNHKYKYQWFRDNGTPAGEELTWATTSELQVTTDSIDTFWVKITGTHTVVVNGTTFVYDDVTVSPRMYVSLYGTCQMPPLKVTQYLPPVITDPVVLTAYCDWPGVEFHWYWGQSGDTRYEVPSDLNAPNRLEVDPSSIYPYWVRATLPCGAVQDSPTIIFQPGTCGPVLINPNIASKEVAYGGTTYLDVDPIAVDNPAYVWHQNEGQETPVTDTDGIATRLTLQNVTTSGRYWVDVRNLDCSNGAESYMATVRVASHPAIRPPEWQTEVWTDSGTSTTLNGMSIGGVQYQWYRGEVGDERLGTLIEEGGMGATYTTPALTAESKYWVRVTEPNGGIVDSPTMTVKICEPPRIVSMSHPSVYLLPGEARYLDVTAAGTGLTYQWYEGGTPGNPATGTPIGRAIDRLLIRPSQTTTYWLLITGHCGVGGNDVRTKVATFTASVCPIVPTPTAANPVVMPGAKTTLSISATGHALQYQWYIGTPGVTTSPIAGAVTATIETPAIHAATSFWCRVTSGECSRNSEAVVVGLCSEPTIRWITGNKSVAKGEVVDFILDADHSTATPIVTVYSGPAGNVAASTELFPAGPVYHFTQTFNQTKTLWARAVVGNCHADTGNITVTVCLPRIDAHPAGASITAGASHPLSVVTDIPAAGYQWYTGASGDVSNPITGATSASLTVTPSATTSYWVRVKGCGSFTVDSTAAVVTVCTPATIASQPPDISMVKGTTRELTVNASGTNLTYRWYRGLKGDTTNQIGNSFSVFVSPSDTTKYWARVSNGCGSKDTETITVNVCATPGITTQPLSQSIFSGTTATLSVVATQETSTPLAYQWYSGTSGSGTIINGAISATYTTAALTSAANYWVKVTAGTCSINSATATVSMCSYPQTMNAPDDKDIAVGGTARLSASVSPIPDQVRWYRGAQGDYSNLIGSSSFVDVSPTVTTQYWGTFTKDGCVMKSRTVTVHVSIPTITQQPAATTQVNGGQTATLTVAANTTGLAYQWYSGTSGSGTAITGEIGASFTTPANAGGVGVVLGAGDRLARPHRRQQHGDGDVVPAGVDPDASAGRLDPPRQQRHPRRERHRHEPPLPVVPLHVSERGQRRRHAVDAECHAARHGELLGQGDQRLRLGQQHDRDRRRLPRSDDQHAAGESDDQLGQHGHADGRRDRQHEPPAVVPVVQRHLGRRDFDQRRDVRVVHHARAHLGRELLGESDQRHLLDEQHDGHGIDLLLSGDDQPAVRPQHEVGHAEPADRLALAHAADVQVVPRRAGRPLEPAQQLAVVQRLPDGDDAVLGRVHEQRLHDAVAHGDDQRLHPDHHRAAGVAGDLVRLDRHALGRSDRGRVVPVVPRQHRPGDRGGNLGDLHHAGVVRQRELLGNHDRLVRDYDRQ